LQKRISLVLGSGGARGLAHIGVIHWLEEHGYHIQSVSGCSMGALIGGIYAAGKLDEYESWVRAITKTDIIKLLDLSWGKSGLVKGDKIINTLTELVGDVVIEDLPVAFTAVATDILHGKEVWISKGSLFEAIRASISLPLFFTPFRYKDIDLIDGGVLNPVPIAPTFSDTTDLTIAVSLGGKATSKIEMPVIKKSINENSLPFTRKIAAYVESFKAPTQSNIRKEWGAYEIANQAFEAMQETIARQKLAAYPAEHLVEIARNACGTLEFDRAAEMIELGYNRAQKCLGRS
jgi:NTE family protein